LFGGKKGGKITGIILEKGPPQLSKKGKGIQTSSKKNIIFINSRRRTGEKSKNASSTIFGRKRSLPPRGGGVFRKKEKTWSFTF